MQLEEIFITILGALVLASFAEEKFFFLPCLSIVGTNCSTVGALLRKFLPGPVSFKGPGQALKSLIHFGLSLHGELSVRC